ncbi:nitrate ABC transporter permease [Micromonospora sp. KC721]|uniref:nitrate ABC transporter permease n=1 Tax=Micromonospora sp. KC721 TaxID=2530380 RepID=UPI001FB7FDF1|nr:nitrate ABC transporter permease [Micromonospora sp. KC721]
MSTAPPAGAGIAAPETSTTDIESPAPTVGVEASGPRGRATADWLPALGSRLIGVSVTTFWALVGLAVFVALWQLATRNSATVPGPLDSARTLGDLLSRPFFNTTNDKGIGLHLYISLRRVFMGFGLAALVGITLGLAMGAARPVWSALNPLVQVLRPVSPLAWFPIWLYIIQEPSQSAIIVIFITTLWPTLINTAAGAVAIPHDQRNVALVFKFRPLAYLWHVLIPNALPSIITGLRLSMGIGWMVIVAVEMLQGNSGVGYFVWNSYNALELDKVVAAIVLIGVVGLVLDTVLLRLARWVTPEEVHG